MREGNHHSSEAAWLPAINEAVRAHAQMIVEGRGNEGEARLAIQKVLRETGYQPELDAGDTPADFCSFERQNLVIETNVDMARGYAQAVSEKTRSTLDGWPEKNCSGSAKDYIHAATHTIKREQTALSAGMNDGRRQRMIWDEDAVRRGPTGAWSR